MPKDEWAKYGKNWDRFYSPNAKRKAMFQPTELLKAMPFGKYKGQKFSNIPKGYLEWCLKQEFCNKDEFRIPISNALACIEQGKQKNKKSIAKKKKFKKTNLSPENKKLLEALENVPNVKWSEPNPGSYHIRFIRSNTVYAHWYPKTGNLFLGEKADKNTSDVLFFNLDEVLDALEHPRKKEE